MSFDRGGPNYYLSKMSEKRSSSEDVPDPAAEGALHESFPGMATPAQHTSYFATDADHGSVEAQERRKKLVAEINAGWSEVSECALSAIAERFFQKS
jgi:hypothetical protein